MSKDILYTSRWYADKIIEISPNTEVTKVATELRGVITNALGETVSAPPQMPAPEPEIERPDRSARGQKQLFHPLADRRFNARTIGNVSGGLFRGAVVHYTAGHCETEQDAVNLLRSEKQWAYWLIGPTGKIYATHPLNRWGYHAGPSHWPALGSGVSQHLLGIEVLNAGKLDNNRKSWFGRTYPADRCRTVPKKDNVAAGIYVKYTEAQERALTELLLWLKNNDPNRFDLNLVLGHDEVSPGRKVDPGGALSMTMPEYRKYLIDQYNG